MNSLSVESASPMPDQPLPPEVSLQSDNWWMRYRNYPVFSRTWYRHRALAFYATFGIAIVLIAFVYMLINPDWTKFLVAAVPIFCGFVALSSLGQFMAVGVRQRNFPVRKEAMLLICVLSLGAALSWGIYAGLRYSSKYLVYGDGSIVLRFGDNKHDEDVSPGLAKQKTQPSSANLNSSTASPVAGTAHAPKEEKTSGPSGEKLSPQVEMILNVVQILPFVFIYIHTGSGFDLLVFFRQRKKLIETQRQQELQRAQDARREAELRLSVLVAQVEPHFLFNTLAGVRSAILTEPARATAIVDHLVDYLRATIPQMRDDGASVQGRLAQQLEAARAYLGLMQARIPRLSFSVDSEIADAAVPPLMLISLVENAIKHGVEPKVGKVHISHQRKTVIASG